MSGPGAVDARARILVLTAAEMRAADEACVRAGTPVETLMERAGQGAVEAIERAFGTQRGYRVHVACGRGNNGGDGFVVARLLALRGAHVEVRLLGAPAELAGAARANYDRLAGTGVALVDRAPAREPDLVVDAVLGTGARGALPEAFRDALTAATASPRTRVVALDLPTGVDSDSGRALAEGGWVLRADLTVTFAHLKRAHVLEPGRALCGAIAVVDIGVEPAEPAPGAAPPLELATPGAMGALVPRRAPTAHKGDAGRVLVVGGSAGLAGAVAMAGRSALRAGAGLVTAVVPAGIEAGIKPAMLEVMTLPLPDGPGRALGVTALVPILARAGAAEALAVGPGLSRSAGAAELARRLVAESPAPVVLDADGLNAFEGRAAELFGGRGARKAALVATPHVGEMARLSGLDGRTIERERIDVARRFAREWNAVVVLKGAPTVTAAPDGRATVNATGNPGMATAGMGDVLTGAISAFVAQGLAPYDAARLGVFVHGLAADLAHGDVGPLGLVAGDVTARLPRAMQSLLPVEARSSVVRLPRERFAPVPPDGIRSL